MTRSRLRAVTLLALLGAAAPCLPAAEPKPAPAAVAPTPTTIESEYFDMRSTDTETVFLFEKNVVVTATNLRINCDKLDATLLNLEDEKTRDLETTDKFKILVATGNVRIVQDDRVVTCGRAEVFPREGRIVLTQAPVITIKNSPYTATGDSFVLLRGERRITGVNVRGTLPPINDLGETAKPASPGLPLPAPRPAK